MSLNNRQNQTRESHQDESAQGTPRAMSRVDGDDDGREVMSIAKLLVELADMPPEPPEPPESVNGSSQLTNGPTSNISNERTSAAFIVSLEDNNSELRTAARGADSSQPNASLDEMKALSLANNDGKGSSVDYSDSTIMSLSHQYCVAGHQNALAAASAGLETQMDIDESVVSQAITSQGENEKAGLNASINERRAAPVVVEEPDDGDGDYPRSQIMDGNDNVAALNQKSKTGDSTKNVRSKLERVYLRKDEITDMDVIGGIDSTGSLHPGNQRYRDDVEACKPHHHQLGSKHGEKRKIRNAIVDDVGRRGGRFVSKDRSGRFYLLTRKEAEDKVSQALKPRKSRAKIN